MKGTSFSTMLNTRLRCFLQLHRNRSRSFSTFDRSEDEDERWAVTRKIRLLGLRSSQPGAALALYDDFVHRQKKRADLKMFAAAINCATVAKDLAKGREIHQLIERDYPQFSENLMLKQQLRFMYSKCQDERAAAKLFPNPPNDS